MPEARSEVGEARRPILLNNEPLAFRYRPANASLQRFDIEAGLDLKGLVEKSRDREELLGDTGEFPLSPAFGKCVHDQGIELGVLRFLHPMMLEQALEQGIDPTGIAD